jgi:hypothetical protein
MTKIELQILDLIQSNRYLSQDLKQRYILALFMMRSKEQREYLEIIKAFSIRCEQIDRGLFILPSKEAKRILRTVEEVKQDLIDKINSSN